MEIIILGMLFLIVTVVSYHIQMLCLKHKKKTMKAVPAICTIIFAIVFVIQCFSFEYDNTFFGFEISLDNFGIALILLVVCLIALIGVALGVILAWITHGIRYMLQKKQNNIE